MASHRVHHRHTLEEIEAEVERKRAAENASDREYTTPERLAALRGEPYPSPPEVEDAALLKQGTRASPPGRPARGHEVERKAAADLDAEVEEWIREGIDDFEREGSCAPRGTGSLVEPSAGAARATEGGDRGGRRVAEGKIGREERGLLPREPQGARAVVRPRAARRREPASAWRIDYRAAAPGAFAAMSRLEAYVRRCGLERPLLQFVELRASQLNGCAYCVDARKRKARRAGAAEQRLDALEAWKEKASLFSLRERAALAWTEAVTRLGPDHVSDRTFRIVREQFTEAELVNLTVAIIAINGWNRLAIAFRSERGLRES